MRVLAGGAERGPIVSSTIIVGSLAVLATAIFTGAPMRQVVPAVAIAVASTIAYRTLLSWRALLASTILIILFIPIRRYTMPGHLPFQLEPYRLSVALIAIGWLGSLLVDPRVRLRGSAISAPLWTVVFVAAASIIVNGHRVNALGVGSTVIKGLTFLLSYLIVFYLILSVARRRGDIEYLIRILVGGAAVVSIFGLIEAWSRYNIFNHLSSFFPLLKLADTSGEVLRGGHTRVLASSQHPIALGAMLVMLLPLAIYLGRSTGRRIWWASGFLMLICALATLSRTGIVMLLVLGLVYVRRYPRTMKRMWPLIVPALLAVHFAVPGALGTFKSSFFPTGGLVAQQRDAPVGSGRVSSFGPGMHIVGQHPLLGEGFATRVVDGPHPNSFIVDDGWLSTAMETGVIGVLAWLWLFTRYVRRLSRLARREDGEYGWLLTGLAGSVLAYAVGMLTYDAFSFIQATFVMFILLALGAAAMAGAAHQQPQTA
jgi:hypothetical protein